MPQATAGAGPQWTARLNERCKRQKPQASTFTHESLLPEAGAPQFPLQGAGLLPLPLPLKHFLPVSKVKYNPECQEACQCLQTKGQESSTAGVLKASALFCSLPSAVCL